MHLIFIIQLLCTLFMTGLIWFVQVVHYPLFQPALSSGGGTTFHADHVRRTTWVVMPVMLAELATAIIWCVWLPAGGSRPLAWIGLGLLAVVWLSTAFLQVPCHDSLARGWDPEVHRRLVASNWLRTVSWSARTVLLLAVLMEISQ